ncbi:MAG: DALR anticodon-binding domain-containing protein, partial [Bacteroidota bacterium]
YSIQENGQPLGSFYGYKVQGIFQSDDAVAAAPFQTDVTAAGDIQFVDINGDGKIDDFDSNEAHELYRILGLGALKYFLLKVEPKKRMLFNPEESIDFHGHTGPFIQYNYARISSVLRKAKEAGVEIKAEALQAITQIHPTERDLIILLSQYPSQVKEAGDGYAPSVIAQYVYEVAKAYGRVWSEVSILGESDAAIKHFRVALSQLTAQTIRQGMSLLGILVPEKM